MRRLLAFSILGTAMAAVPAQAQLDRMGGTSGDVRTPDRPISAPPLRFPEAAGFPSDSMKFLDSIGPRTPEEVLKNLDKDLSRRSTEAAVEPKRDPLDILHEPGETLGKRHPARTTFK
ncbi:hypothetical protein [Nitrospira moscoviensis]|uniref:Uncharacterized protein n=1 Tax=Nitrospira moscoviensis TaxID=42253 RepID=A0A0K2GC02_NITMO|nr:hypothetical protein [Nitrospira moscoviensis]ALA58394.1 exported protein of unknown function [Nitrospira moscoviensis]